MADTDLEDALELLYACPVGIVQATLDGGIVMVNPMAMNLLLPISADGIVVNLFTVLNRYSPELRSKIREFTDRQGTLCENLRIFVNAAGKNGAADAHVLSCTLIKINDRKMIATLSDVSQQVVQEGRLRQAETWFATLIDSVNDFAVISLDRHGIIDGVNPAAALLTGASQEVMIGQRLDRFDTPEQGGSTYSALEQMAIAQRDGWHLDEGWRQRANGERFWCQRLLAARSEDMVRGERIVSGYTVVLRDVTRGDSDSARLKEMLTTDHLTGACNRAHFFELAERQRSRRNLNEAPLSIIVLDIDCFKQINDNHGHAAGDTTLKLLTRLCRSLLRATDTFARMGGEEFVVLLPGMDLDGSVRTAERLRIAIAAMPVQLGDAVINITASFGCAVMDGNGISLAEALEVADRCLYRAKRGGRNRVEPALSSPVSSPVAVTSPVPRARRRRAADLTPP
ncbi:sensor domain-containing diguanylate cyclase [Polymorphobacter fuscus]|nr:diguanylate cyclase [Polymorphobacter fuscus]NJC09799.1 diguanylate cyclase (GGDEF)-like protein/PAS domain S-box-containing protein [Polymorphobacter fuscus]